MQTPQYRIDSLDALMRTPIAPRSASSTAPPPTSLAGTANAGNAAVGGGAQPGFARPTAIPAPPPAARSCSPTWPTSTRGVAPEIVNHYNVQPVFDVYANVDRRDLGAVGSAVEKIMRRDASRSCRAAPRIDLRGQVATMQTSFYRLGLGMIFAVVLVYLLMAVNFQSWLDPFIILMALPGALAGIVWMLFLTQTTFSVPSLMGSIMCIGVATANSILMVVFANDQREEGMDAALGRAVRRPHAHPPGADDGQRHDHRHAADGARHGRRRRAERAAGPRRDRRPDAGHHHHAVRGSDWFTACCARSRRWIIDRRIVEEEHEYLRGRNAASVRICHDEPRSRPTNSSCAPRSKI